MRSYFIEGFRRLELQGRTKLQTKGIFKTQSNIYDGECLGKYLFPFSC